VKIVILGNGRKGDDPSAGPPCDRVRGVVAGPASENMVDPGEDCNACARFGPPAISLRDLFLPSNRVGNP